jgi:hypothetical protein
MDEMDVVDMADAIEVVDEQEEAGDKLELIRTQMPEIYAGIKDRAGELGNDVYVLVHGGLHGEPNCFYAVEFRSTSFAPYGLVKGTRKEGTKHGAH